MTQPEQSKYSLKNVLQQEPVTISTAAMAVFNLLSLTVVEIPANTLAATNVVISLCLGLFTRNNVTPYTKGM